MSVSSVGTSTAAQSYLQSLLPQPSSSTAATDPVSQLLAAFYPTGRSDPAATSAASSDASTAAPGATSSGGSCPNFSPDTMATLISAQGQWGANPVAAQAQSLFTQVDADGDGKISKSEFEDVFGSNADLTKVDGLFNALDSNGDGAVGEDELKSAAQQSHAHHHHRHMHGAGSGGGGGLSGLLNSAGASSSATNSDGSTTTSITYADGSTVSATMPASTKSAAAGASSGSSGNLLEQLIRLQAQLLPPSTIQDLATI